jgi:hypothetical protein
VAILAKIASSSLKVAQHSRTNLLSLAGSSISGAPILLIEAINATGGVNQFLFAGKEGMASRADLKTDLFFSRPGCERLATTASNSRVKIFRMNLFLHSVNSPKILKIPAIAELLKLLLIGHCCQVTAACQSGLISQFNQPNWPVSAS